MKEDIIIPMSVQICPYACKNSTVAVLFCSRVGDASISCLVTKSREQVGMVCEQSHV